MVKAIDPAAVITDVRVEWKEGGKSGPMAAARPLIRALAVTVSNRAAAGVYADKSGPVLAELLRSAGMLGGGRAGGRAGRRAGRGGAAGRGGGGLRRRGDHRRDRADARPT